MSHEKGAAPHGTTPFLPVKGSPPQANISGWVAAMWL